MEHPTHRRPGIDGWPDLPLEHRRVATGTLWRAWSDCECGYADGQGTGDTKPIPLRIRRLRPVSVICLLFALFAAPSSPAAAVTSGIDTLFGGFDFSEGKTVRGEDFADADIWPFEAGHFEIGPDPADWQAARGGGGVDAHGIVPLADVTVAPDPEEEDYWSRAPLVLTGHTYAAITKEGHFAKFRVLAYDESRPYESIVIEWVFQNDGSRDFSRHTTAAIPGTWARLKALARAPGTHRR